MTAEERKAADRLALVVARDSVSRSLAPSPLERFHLVWDEEDREQDGSRHDF